MRSRGQGSFEYLLLLGGILLIVVLALVILRGGFLAPANQQIAGSIHTFRCVASGCQAISTLVVHPSGANASLTFCEYVSPASVLVYLYPSSNRSNAILFNGSSDSPASMFFSADESGKTRIFLDVIAKNGTALNASEPHCVYVLVDGEPMVTCLCGTLGETGGGPPASPPPSPDNPPNVSLNSPANGSIVPAGAVSFNFTPIDDNGFSSATLWGNFTGVWGDNASTLVVANGTGNALSNTIAPGYYEWNVQVCDNATVPQCVFSPSNYSLRALGMFISLDLNSTPVLASGRGGASGRAYFADDSPVAGARVHLFLNETELTDWHDDQWNYRRSITITNNLPTPFTNYQVRLTLTGANFNYADAKADGGDLRFTSITQAPLDYWIESWIPGGTSYVWVEVPSLPASSDTVVYLYYGNNLATTTSNGTNTFDFFDDFESGSLNQWALSGSVDITSATIWDGSTSDVLRIKANADWPSAATNADLPKNGVLEFYAKQYVEPVVRYLMRLRVDGSNNLEYYYDELNPPFRKISENGVNKALFGGFQTGVWRRHKYVANDTYTAGYIDGVLQGSTYALTDGAAGQLQFLTWNNNGFYYDNVFYHKYAYIEPSISVGPALAQADSWWFTNATGHYNASFTPVGITGAYVLKVNTTSASLTGENWTALAVESAPRTVWFSVNSSTGANYSSEDLQCWAQGEDEEQTSLTAYWRWLNGSTLFLSGQTPLANASAGSLSTLSNANTLRGETWQCSVLFSDGFFNESDWNTAPLAVLNSPPLHFSPILNSTTNNNLTSDNLECWNQSTSDADNDSVKNIYNWRKNGTSAPLLYLPFEGGSNSTWTRDYSGLGNNGTVSGPVWSRTAGFDGRGAYAFVNNQIRVPHSVSLNHGGNYTLTAWFYLNSWTNFNGILLKSNFSQGGATQYQMQMSDNVVKSMYTYAGGNGGVGAAVNSGANFVVTGQWIFAAITQRYDGPNTNVTFYKNGAYHSTGTAAGKTFNSNADLYIGNSVFNGTIDEVRVYNYTLSPQQILALYQNRTDLIVSNELRSGDLWQCSVTPNDGYSDGETNSSNLLSVV